MDKKYLAKIIAKDNQGLKLISACCFKAKVKIEELKYLKKNSKKKIIPDLIMVPLVAFDDRLNRIGYGKGYYDRSLRKINKIKKNKNLKIPL